MATKVMAATTPKDLDAVFKLRHEVFIEHIWTPLLLQAKIQL
jgi:N-acyl-L-homoserine lactone synthetase